MDDVEPVGSSACGDGSDKSGSRFMKPKEPGSTEEVGQLGIILSGNCSRVSAKRRVVAN